jgi:hypothetical protein
MNRDAAKRTSALNLYTDPGTINFSTRGRMLAGLYAQPGDMSTFGVGEKRWEKVALKNRLAWRWPPELL